MNKIILAAAIMNAINSTPEVVPAVGNWDNVIAMPTVEEGVQVDPRNPHSRHKPYRQGHRPCLYAVSLNSVHDLLNLLNSQGTVEDPYIGLITLRVFASVTVANSEITRRSVHGHWRRTTQNVIEVELG